MIQNFNGGLLNNYSTEEQVIGTWIDGKPIYRVVKHKDNVSISSDTSFAIPNDLLPDNVGIIETLVNNVVALKGYGSDRYIIRTYFNIYKNNSDEWRALATYGFGGTSRTLIIVWEYTKTTD